MKKKGHLCLIGGTNTPENEYIEPELHKEPQRTSISNSSVSERLKEAENELQTMRDVTDAAHLLLRALPIEQMQVKELLDLYDMFLSGIEVLDLYGAELVDTGRQRMTPSEMRKHARVRNAYEYLKEIVPSTAFEIAELIHKIESPGKKRLGSDNLKQVLKRTIKRSADEAAFWLNLGNENSSEKKAEQEKSEQKKTEPKNTEPKKTEKKGKSDSAESATKKTKKDERKLFVAPIVVRTRETNAGVARFKKSREFSKPGMQLKVTLKGSRPAIWRRVHVPGDCNLAELHKAIQDAMGWKNSYMHQFTINKKRYSSDSSRGLNEYEYTLHDLGLKAGDKFDYEYDFGDSWRHSVEVESTLNVPIDYFECVEGKLACPPEDCGGILGYYFRLTIFNNPKHPMHEETRNQWGRDFDPDKFE